MLNEVLVVIFFKSDPVFSSVLAPIKQRRSSPKLCTYTSFNEKLRIYGSGGGSPYDRKTEMMIILFIYRFLVCVYCPKLE